MKMSRKIECPITKEELENLYNVEKKSPTQISTQFSVSRPTFLRWMRNFNIPLRDHEEASKIVGENQIGKKRNNKLEAHEKLNDYEWLYDIRVNQKKSQWDIGEILGCSEVLVKQYLIKHQIENFRVGMYSREILTKEVIENAYNSGLTMRQLADKFDVSLGVISTLFSEYDIIAKNPNDYDKPHVKVSKSQKEIYDFIKSFYNNEIKINDRTTIINEKNKELDIYMPDKKIAIEYNGLIFHHEEAKGKDKWYHFNKTNACENDGIFLFHVWSDIWAEKPEIIKSMIKNKLGFIDRKIFARKTIIQEVPKYLRKKFFEDNHIQGEDNASISYGLYSENELVACMSFSISRFNKNYDWELIRYANKLNTIVLGGFSKLLKHFKKNNKGSIISYSDRSYASGKVYSLHGFISVGEPSPDYMYLDKNLKRMSKRGFRKDIIQSQFGLDMTNMTESEAMKLLGYKRVWDAGKITWVLI
jgi:transposase